MASSNSLLRASFSASSSRLFFMASSNSLSKASVSAFFLLASSKLSLLASSTSLSRASSSAFIVLAFSKASFSAFLLLASSKSFSRASFLAFFLLFSTNLNASPSSFASNSCLAWAITSGDISIICRYKFISKFFISSRSLCPLWQYWCSLALTLLGIFSSHHVQS